MSTRYQFTVSVILVQPSAAGIGPFSFDLGPQLPTGDDIVSIVVKSYLDTIETTSSLISGGPTVAGNIVSVYFDYPSADLHGDHKLTFIYTLVSGAIDEADFFKVTVSDH
jgi:hypothetical protein